MRRVQVRTPGGRYPVLIGPGIVDRAPSVLRRKPSRWILVTDSRVGRRHGRRVGEALAETGVPVTKISLPAGEATKSVVQLERIWRTAVKAGTDRRACFVALGGGVIGDLTGFAAASTLRGVDVLQIPTTLLAMVDASVGGKTGINLPEGKNLVGAFHQPRGVVMDLELLDTLPEREYRAGWAEIIKTAAIRDAKLFRTIERRRDALLARDRTALAEVVARCVRIKAAVVEEDEREGGLRMILNFGHTLAHGIEAAQGYSEWLHGEAVAAGMVFAARLGETLGVTASGIAERLESVIEAYGLPSRAKGLPYRRVLAAMDRDKKRGPQGLRWVFLETIGTTRISDDVPAATFQSALRTYLKGG